MASRDIRLVSCLLALLLPACAATGSASDDGEGSTDTGSTGDDGTADDSSWPEQGHLACNDAAGCRFLFVSQTLDDRLEIFAPDSDTPHRSTISIDLKPNLAGDNSGEALDEPFGLAVADDFLHVLVGHYPSRDRGSLLSLPLRYLSEAQQFISTDAYFEGGSAQPPVVMNALGEMEPIFMLRHARGPLVVGVFNNDLFLPEDMWTEPGRLLVLDPSEPSGAPSAILLDDIEGSACAGAGQVIELGSERIAVACDGNEAVAIVDATRLQQGGAEPAALCDLPPTSGARVRYLAPDGQGGLVVAESPTTASNDPARLWWYDATCNPLGVGDVAPNQIGGLNQVIAVPGQDATWMVAGSLQGRRGIHVARGTQQAIEVCGPLEGLAEQWSTPGGDIEPFALALSDDASRLAIGAGPFSPSAAMPGYGKVLWVELRDGGSCGFEVAAVEDLTDGGPGHAPAVDPDDPSTWRRAPDVVRIHAVHP